MAMVRCRECGGEVSSEAAVCPHCGIREPASAAAVAAPGVAARHPHDHDPVGRDHLRDRPGREPVRRKGGKAGWTVALLLLLVLAALFGLWYGNIVDFN